MLCIVYEIALETLVKVVNDHISFLCRTASGELIGVRLADILQPVDTGTSKLQSF